MGGSYKRPTVKIQQVRKDKPIFFNLYDPDEVCTQMHIVFTVNKPTVV